MNYPLHERFEKVLAWYNTQNVNLLAITGDLVDRNQQTNWDIFSNSWKKYKGELQLIAVMGNHDVWGEINTAADRFYAATGQQPNTHYVIGGYHFIMLSAGTGNFTEMGGGIGGLIASGRSDISGSTASSGDVIPVSVKDWVRERIDYAKNDTHGKPIFVFMHIPIYNTTFRSDLVTRSTTSFGEDPYTGFFKDDPEVIVFSGHIHVPNSVPASIWQGGFTAV